MWKQQIRQYFEFSARERKGILILIGGIIILQLLPRVHQRYFLPEEPVEIAILPHATSEHAYALMADSNRRPEPVLFHFDPNSLDMKGWIKLGIREKTAKTILNYRAKGGRFYKADDLRKIWGMSQNDATRLIPYVVIEVRPARNPKQFASYEPVRRSYQQVEINAADSSEWKSLPGIGSKLAMRIMAFRDKLGGFYSVHQVGETYFLPDSTFQKIKSLLTVDASRIRRININEADYVLLVKHPYVDKDLANAILQYRKQHGSFEQLSDLKKIMLLHDSTYEKVKHYLAVQQTTVP